MKRRLVSLSGAILLGLGVSLVHAEDADEALSRVAAERVAIGTCATCHGPQGHSLSPKFPVLAGQHVDYLEQALTTYRNGRRKNVVMGSMAQLLKTEEDVKVAAAYFAGQESPLATATTTSK